MRSYYKCLFLPRGRTPPPFLLHVSPFPLLVLTAGEEGRGGFKHYVIISLTTIISRPRVVVVSPLVLQLPKQPQLHPLEQPHHRPRLLLLAPTTDGSKKSRRRQQLLLDLFLQLALDPGRQATAQVLLVLCRGAEPLIRIGVAAVAVHGRILLRLGRSLSGRGGRGGRFILVDYCRVS